MVRFCSSDMCIEVQFRLVRAQFLHRFILAESLGKFLQLRAFKVLQFQSLDQILPPPHARQAESPIFDWIQSLFWENRAKHMR